MLRGRERPEALISLGLDALSEASNLGHDMHAVIYDKNASTSDPELQDQLAEVLTCLETAEHYLLMLGSVFEEHPARNAAADRGPRASTNLVPGLEGAHPPARPATPNPHP